MQDSAQDGASPVAGPGGGRSSHRLVVAAHGTHSPAGTATTFALVEAVRAARPRQAVDLCFVDVAAPRLADVLDARPTVVVPLLLSTGVHVQSDIPAVAARFPSVRVARHLGPHPLLTDVLVERLGPVSDSTAVVLVGAGSSRTGADAELAEAARLLGERLGRPVPARTLSDDWPADPPERRQRAPRVRVSTYLLAEGHFLDALTARAGGTVEVAPPLGVHSALVELVWRRYDAALSAGRSETVR
jgi:sirohydrochlorin ferrochelatase